MKTSLPASKTISSNVLATTILTALPSLLSGGRSLLTLGSSAPRSYFPSQDAMSPGLAWGSTYFFSLSRSCSTSAGRKSWVTPKNFIATSFFFASPTTNFALASRRRAMSSSAIHERDDLRAGSLEHASQHAPRGRFLVQLRDARQRVSLDEIVDVFLRRRRVHAHDALFEFTIDVHRRRPVVVHRCRKIVLFREQIRVRDVPEVHLEADPSRVRVESPRDFEIRLERVAVAAAREVPEDDDRVLLHERLALLFRREGRDGRSRELREVLHDPVRVPRAGVVLAVFRVRLAVSKDLDRRERLDAKVRGDLRVRLVRGVHPREHDRWLSLPAPRGVEFDRDERVLLHRRVERARVQVEDVPGVRHGERWRREEGEEEETQNRVGDPHHERHRGPSPASGSLRVR
eukprot:30918-Pelagococcus_subviridis.AAC.35